MKQPSWGWLAQCWAWQPASSLGQKLLFLVARTISDHYFFVSVTSLSIDPQSVIRGLVSGVGATLVAAAVPAVEAASYAPRLAMARSSIESRAGTGSAYAGCRAGS